MSSKRDAPNLRNYSVTRSQWDKMLAAYRERPTIKSVMAAGDIGKRIARRAVMEGWPDLSLPPFVEVVVSGSTVHKEMAVLRESWEEAAVTQGEAARQGAQEAMAARITMKSALQAAQLAQSYAAKLLEKFERNEVAMPEDITPKVVYSIIRALESSASVVEKAMKVEQMQMGKPEQVLGIQIGILLERCNDEELQIVVNTGEMPGRILDQRKRIIEMVEKTDAAEERARTGPDDGAIDDAMANSEVAQSEIAALALAAEEAADMPEEDDLFLPIESI